MCTRGGECPASSQARARVIRPREEGPACLATSEATDVTAGESAVTADGAADDTHASTSAYTTGMDVGAISTFPVTAARKRKVRGSCSHVAQDERKR